MAGYKHPCRYCNGLIPPNSNTCPLCGKVNPSGPLRCPKCKAPIQKGWKACSNCGLPLEITCHRCGKVTFFGDYCDHCENRIMVICPNKKCRMEQPPLAATCIKCGQPLK